MDVLTPADIETLVIGYLSERLDASVSDRRGTAERVVRIDLIGFQRTDHVIDIATVAVQAYDPDAEAARQLCAEAWAELMAAPGYTAADGAYVRDVKSVGLPVPFPDPDAKQPRYQASVDINVTPIEEQS